MNTWPSIADKFHIHFTPSGRRTSKHERAERNRIRRAKHKMGVQRDLYGQRRQRYPP
jgi:hypothetical protein